MLFWLALPALAQSNVRIVEGTPEFESCLGSDSCIDNFYRFLGESMSEQGFSMSSAPQLGDAALRLHDGWQVGGMLTTFPFVERSNLSGKEENTSYSPVLPRLAGAKSFTKGDTRFGIEAEFTPPVKVQGASALVASLDLSAGRATDWGGVSVGLGLSFTRANAPIVASREQFEQRDSFDNPSNLDPDTWEAVCGHREVGCIDTFTYVGVPLRATVAYDLGEHFVPWASVSVAWVEQRLDVEYDATVWGASGVQPTLHAGIAGKALDRLQGHLGASVAPRPDAIRKEGGPVLFRATAGGSVGF